MADQDCSFVVFADLMQVVVGRRHDVLLAYNPYSQFGTDQTQIRATSRWDIAPVNVDGVHLVTGVRP
jgi:HK97 family phage major capsid protein